MIAAAAAGIGACTAELNSYLGADAIGIDLRKPTLPMNYFVWMSGANRRVGGGLEAFSDAEVLGF